MRMALLMFVAVFWSAAVASSQTTRPAIDRAALEIRANEEFNAGRYTTALPMLQKLVELSRGEPDVVGQLKEKIRVCETNLKNPPAAAVPAGPRQPHAPPKPGEVLDIQIKDLGNFDYDADRGGNIPDDVQKLSGSRIRVPGFMIPMDQASNITQFALVPSLFACCFGQPPQLQHTIVVNCPKGKAVSYYPDEITVEGTLTVREKKDEGFIVSIFEIEVSSVKPSAR